jgi:hypothetical protein
MVYRAGRYDGAPRDECTLPTASLTAKTFKTSKPLFFLEVFEIYWKLAIVFSEQSLMRSWRAPRPMKMLSVTRPTFHVKNCRLPTADCFFEAAERSV